MEKQLFFIVFFCFLLLSFASLILVNKLSYRFESDISQRNLNLATAVANHVKTLLEQPLYQYARVQKELETGVNKQEIQDLLDRFTKQNPLLELVQILDKKGISYFISPYNQDYLGLNLSNQAFFSSALNQSGLHWSNAYISLQTQSPSVTISSKFENGVLAAQLNLAQLSRIIQIVPESYAGFLAIVDRRGVIIAHTRDAVSSQSINIGNMASVQKGMAGKTGTIEEKWEGKKGLASVVPISEAGWSVVVFQFHNRALGIVEDIKKLLLFMLGGLGLAVLLGFVFVLSRFKRTIQGFEQQADQVSQGEYNVKISPKYSEFISVSKSFNAMAEKILQRESELKNSEEKYRLMVETANEGVCFVDHQSCFGFVNQRMAEILDCRIKDLSEQPFTKFIFSEDEPFFMEKIEERKKGIKEEYEARFKTLNGKEIWVIFSGAPVFGQEGQYMGSLGMVVDITERKKNQDELALYKSQLETLVDDRTKALKTANKELKTEIENRRLAEIKLRHYAETQEELLKEVNHRVKNNLAAIISVLHKEEDRAEAGRTRAPIDIIRDLIGRIQGLSTVHNLLSASSWQPLHLGQMCKSIIQSALTSMLYTKRVSIHVQSSDIKVSSIQAHHLSLVINELATNSIKHGFKEEKNPEIRVKLKEDETWVRIIFKDNGPGFSKSLIQNDFQDCSVGIELVKGIICHSLGGEVGFSNDSGGVVGLRFRKEEVR